MCPGAPNALKTRAKQVPSKVRAVSYKKFIDRRADGKKEGVRPEVPRVDPLEQIPCVIHALLQALPYDQRSICQPNMNPTDSAAGFGDWVQMIATGEPCFSGAGPLKREIRE